MRSIVRHDMDLGLRIGRAAYFFQIAQDGAGIAGLEQWARILPSGPFYQRIDVAIQPAEIFFKFLF